VSALPRLQRIPLDSESSARLVGQPDKVEPLPYVEAADCKSLISPFGKGNHVPGDHGIGTIA
jgi:hypothetical protein